MNKPTDDPATITGDSPEGWRLERHSHGRLDLIDAVGRRHQDVDVLRAFPVTAPAGPVAVVAADGGELAWVDSLAVLPAALKTILDRELAQREFLPVIERIEMVSDTEPTEWAVDTDRGPHHFTVAHADDVARQSDGSVFVTDTFGMRYRIPRVAALDLHSRRLLEKLA
ncbi:MAG: DUF1854 domain-containing protein [Pirellulales bacterium]